MKIESFEMGCEKLGLDPAVCLPDVSSVPAKHQEAITAFTKLCIIAEAANESKEFDWNDRSEYKWFPWFDMEVDKNNPSGFRFRVTYCALTSAYAGAGSRLCFFTEADAEYHGKQHEPLYKAVMVMLPQSKKAKAKK